MELEGKGRLEGVKKTALAGKIDRRFLFAGQCLLYALLGMVLGFSRVLGDGAPFGIALVACAGAGLTGVSALLGASLGYLVSSGLDWGIRYVAACVLAYTISFVFQEVSLYKQGFFMPGAAALVMAGTGFLSSFSALDGQLPLAAELISESTLAFGGCYFFREALSNELRTTEGEELRHSVALMILAACSLTSFGAFVLFDTVSVGRVAALTLLMTSAMKGGMLTGAAVGTVMGLAMDVSGAGAAFYTMAYSFSGLSSGVFGKHGRVVFIIAFSLAQALAVVCAWDENRYLGAMLEVFSAAVIFMLLPGSILNHAALLLQYREHGYGESGLRRFAARRVAELGQAYEELFEILQRSISDGGSDENIARVFDRAAERVCVGCVNKNRCWNSDYLDTLGALNDATKAMALNGRLNAEDLPGHFREKCLKLAGFVAAVNTELRYLAYRRQLKSKLSENRSLAWGQYMDIAQVLETVARELGSVNGSDPLAERRLIRYLSSMDIDADAAVFRDGGGRLHVTVESGRLAPLTGESEYLERLSAVVGVRLCRPPETAESSSRLSLLQAEPLAVSVGIAALKKRGESVSGDKGTYFKTDAGVLCVILSDGMGSGDEAARDSSQVIGILEKFLRSGVDPAVAMRILNSVMLLRSADSWGFATVDLMCVDLFSGETCFYKYGAAPSYVMSGKSIRRITGESLAAGLSMGEGCNPDIVRMKLQPGCTALIASDGVIVDAEDQWLKSLLQRSFEDMKALARATLKEAERLYGANDDMTVLTVRVEERA